MTRLDHTQTTQTLTRVTSSQGRRATKSRSAQVCPVACVASSGQNLLAAAAPRMSHAVHGEGEKEKMGCHVTNNNAHTRHSTRTAECGEAERPRRKKLFLSSYLSYVE